MNGEWRLNLEHQGIEIEFPGTPPIEIRTAIGAQGFRWSGKTRVWYTKDAPDRREWVAAQAWATQGEPVGTRPTFEERMAIKAERAAARGERLAGYTESAETRAARQLQSCREIGDIRPMAQTYSDIASLSRHMSPPMDRSVSAGTNAQVLQNTSGGAQSKGYDNPAFLARRIKECVTQLGRLARFTQEPGAPPLHKLLADVRSKLEFCQKKLEELGGSEGATAGNEPQQGPIKTPGEVA